MATQRICITIDKEDYDYCKKTGLKPSKVLRSRLKEIRLRRIDGINISEINKKLIRKLERVFKVLEEVLDVKTFNTIVEKI